MRPASGETLAGRRRADEVGAGERRGPCRRQASRPGVGAGQDNTSEQGRAQASRLDQCGRIDQGGRSASTNGSTSTNGQRPAGPLGRPRPGTKILATPGTPNRKRIGAGKATTAA